MRWLLPLALLFMSLSGCLSEAPDEADTPAPEPGPEDGMTDDPGYELPETISGMEYVAQGHPGSTTGIWLHNDLALLSGTGVGLRIVDISDPANPVILANETADVGNSRDVDVIVHPNGKTYAVLTAGGVDLVDITNATAPQLISTAGVNSHNMGVVPNTTIVYNSRSISAHAPGPGESGQVDLIDFADPDNPVIKVFPFPAVIQDPQGKPRSVQSTTCHDITFNEELARAYCAGVTDTTIWDISDPWNPEIIQVIDWPGTNIHHGVWDARGGDLLILGDEFGGVATPSPPCSSTVRDPTSALWFFDISDIAVPTPVGYFQIEHDQLGEGSPGLWPYCSTHFGEVIEDRDLLVMGWYSAGTVLVDFTDTLNPEQVAHYYTPGTNTWEARHYKGYIYTGDTGLGMEILKLI